MYLQIRVKFNIADPLSRDNNFSPTTIITRLEQNEFVVTLNTYGKETLH